MVTARFSAEERRGLVLVGLWLCDVAIFGFGLWVAAQSHGLDPLPIMREAPGRTLGWLVAAAIAWHAAMKMSGVYRSHRLSSAQNVREILNGSALGSLFAAGLAVLFQLREIPFAVAFTAWMLAAVLTMASRLVLYRVLVLLRRHGRNLRAVLILGSGSRAEAVLGLIKDAAAGYRALGYVDAEPNREWEERTGLRYLGSLPVLPKVLAANVVDEVFVALPLRSHYDATAVAIRQCEEQGVLVRLPLDIFLPAFSKQYVDRVNGRPIFTVAPSAAPLLYRISKRVLDVVVSLILLVVQLPLFLVVAFLIKRDSPGPVFFVQERVGLNKRPFRLIKFRTMHIRSEEMIGQLEHLNEAGGPVFKIKDDPRITRVGRVLRRTSIDELPQLINVFVGSMSLVGPRPLPLRDVEGFTIDWQRRRFSVRPGITCLWQISGRSQLSFEQWMQLDMDYIDSRSFLGDLEILARTVPIVLKQTGAY
ncbi:MAG: sugar transferase [Rhodocyclaceae bacterium]|nr:sugar transferase [Rhodocyclaceae bacterium]